MNDKETPDSPLHPGPNEEINPQNLPTTKLQDDSLNLNPELYDEDDEEENEAIEKNNITIPENLEAEDSKIAQQEIVPNVEEEGLEEEEFEDIDLTSLNQLTLPFEEQLQNFISTNLSNNSNALHQEESLSLTQQSKFINYIDEKLLILQRQFIKQQSESKIIYPLIDLIKNLNEIINLIWKSISLNFNNNNNQKLNLFGQEEYYIKILGDLEEYLLHYQILFKQNFEIDSQGKRFINIDINEIIQFFKFLINLDLQMSVLLGSSISNGDEEIEDSRNISTSKKSKFSNTEIIRLSPIVNRIRILIIEKLERLSKEIKSKNLKNLLELESSKIFEGTLERI
ncbi:uncharacterized protein KGF55_001411 [Candida pseudojiufengensis]|uniref:uncharacterized protein n=1 Tax=Candida pseudojiufengensis TaxID=497109 RepID=UPI0022241378|nr:uncharacterized protein KGF55_001411 [Candida pseudojiufengensis]KAI5965191.1 hypothetical protein KGF55_001411 [Candida pseudojiufengensis]